MVPDPFFPTEQQEDLRAAFLARLVSPEIQSRVTDAEMELLDDEARAEFRIWRDQLAPSVDLDTAIRGLIGYTRLQAEQGNYEDPNADFFAQARARSEQGRADRDRLEADRDRKRRQRKAIKAARKRNRGR